MQAITDELQAILKAKFQAGATGFRGRVEIIDPAGEVATDTSWRTLDIQINGVATNPEPSGWKDPGFDASTWADAHDTTDFTHGAPYASPPVDIAGARYIVDPTVFAEAGDPESIWLGRRAFYLPNVPASDPTLHINVDNELIGVWVNAHLIATLGDGTWDVDHTYAVDRTFLLIGQNVVAVEVLNRTAGGGFAQLALPITGLATLSLQPTSVSIDKSLRLVADQASVAFANEDLEDGWGPDSVFTTNQRMRIYQWFGDVGNAILTFTGVIDQIQDHRDVLTTSLTCRDMMAVLVDQTFSASGPQGADEAGAVRTEDNGVYLAREVSYIVNDILDRAGWPTDDRQVTDTSYVLDEFIVSDGASWAETMIGNEQLTGLVGYSAWADEIGVFHFAPTLISQNLTDPATAVYTFRSGEDILSLDDSTDQYDLRTRVKVRGPLTTQTLQDTWRELWRTSKITAPVGIWYDPTDAANIRVISRSTKRLYRLRQSDRVVLSSVNLGSVISHPLGLSGDPADSSIYWVLDAPWIYTGSTSGNSVKKVRKSDNHVLATYSIPNGRWSALKVSSSYLWLTNLDTDRFYKRDKTDGSAIANYSHTYNAVVQANPSGIMVDGTTLYLFWANGGTTARFLKCDESAPGSVTGVVKTAGTSLHGGEMDTTTHTECYGDSDSLNLVAKFTLLQAVDQTDEVSTEVVDTDLEDQLGQLAVLADRIHDSHSGDGAHPFEVRRLTLDLTVITNIAQATQTAQRQLDIASQRRRVLDAGIIGNPALQKTDYVAVIDPPTGISTGFAIDTYRSAMDAAGTYVGTLALLPVADVTDTPTDDGDAS